MDFYDHLKQIGACRQGVEWCHENGVIAAADAWRKLCASDRHEWLIWLALSSPLVPRETVDAFLADTVTRAIVNAKVACADLAWNRWADAWLAGNDRSESAAARAAVSSAARAAAEAAARAAVSSALAAEAAARAAAEAADAARAAAWGSKRVAADAAADAAAERAEELNTQADWWRGQKNPFEEAEK